MNQVALCSFYSRCKDWYTFVEELVEVIETSIVLVASCCSSCFAKVEYIILGILELDYKHKAFTRAFIRAFTRAFTREFTKAFRIMN